VLYPGLSTSPFHTNAQRYLKGGFGGVVAFGLKSGRDGGKRFIDSLKLFSHVANVGDAKSLALHPASTSHSQMREEELKSAGIPPELVRLSVGLEHIADLTEDLSQALRQAAR
jgi:O-acetylhomoserine (thiol)-lyase